MGKGEAYFILVAGSSVVDQDVCSTPFVKRVLDQLLPVSLLGNVGLNEVHQMWMSCVCDSLSSNVTIELSDSDS